MPDTKDGGPAFPLINGTIDHGTEQIILGEPGMSLRDWFAGQALAGLTACDGANYPPDSQAVLAFAFADAMLAARSKSNA